MAAQNRPPGQIFRACAWIREARAQLLAATVLVLAKTSATLAMPFVLGTFLDALFARRPFGGNLALFVALCMSRLVLEPLSDHILSRASRRAELSLQRHVLSHVLLLPPAVTERIGNGELVAKFLRDAGAIGMLLRSFFPRSLAAILLLAGACVSAFVRSWILGVVFLLLLPLSALVFRPYAKKFRKSAHVLRTCSDTSIGRLFEFFHTLPFLQALGAAERFANGPGESLARYRRCNLAGDALAIGFSLAGTAISVCGECTVLGVAGVLAAAGRIPVGDVVAFQMLFLTAAGALQGVVVLLPEATAIREGISSLEELLAKPEEITPPPAGTPAGTGDTDRRDEPPSLECRNVSFGYPGSGGYAVRGLSLAIPGGAVAAITGANGAGKTTLLKLLCGAIRPDSGDIVIGGKPLSPRDLPAFRRRLGAIFQDNLLLSHSFRDNVSLRDPSIGGADIDASLAASGADILASRLPAGLATPLGNGGQSLSGGEIQKVAIARALARKPSLLVLDEVTNHLDAASRAAFCELLETLRGRCTVLLVTHDPAVLRRCDLEIPLERPE